LSQEDSNAVISFLIIYVPKPRLTEPLIKSIIKSMMTENINAHIYLLLKLFTGMPCGHGSSSPPLVQVPGDDAVELIINTFL
jgi:hypothetical protein